VRYQQIPFDSDDHNIKLSMTSQSLRTCRFV